MAWRSERFEMRLGQDEALALDELRERLQLRTRAQVVRRALALLGEGGPERPVVARPLGDGLVSASKPARELFAVCRHGVPDCRVCQTGRWAV